MVHRVINGRTIAGDMLDVVADQVLELKNSDLGPKLLSVKVGESPEIDLCIRNQLRHGEKVSIVFVKNSIRRISPRTR